MGKRAFIKLAAVSALCMVGRLAFAADLSGKYAGDPLTVQIGSDDVGYHGTFTFGAQKFRFGATETDGNLKGWFNANGKAFPFTAQIVGDRMTLQSADKTYSMTKDNSPPPPPGPLKMPAGYSLIRRTTSGQFMTAPKPAAATPREAVISAGKDFDNYFDSDYKPSKIVEDNQTHAAMMGFSATINGESVLGIVSARAKDEGMTAFVEYLSANASKGDRALLLKGEEAAGPAKAVQLQPYKFPDNTGSIGLAEGYTTDAQSIQAGCVIKGPADQEISILESLPVYTPTAQAVRMAQLYPVPNAPAMVISPLVDPVQALANIAPQVSRITWQKGMFAQQIDHLVKVKDMDSGIQGVAQSLATYGVTRVFPDQSRKHLQVLAAVSATPIIQGESWLFTINCCAAPDASFVKDLPTMLAIMSSLKINDQQIAVNTANWIADRKAWFAAEQNDHNATVSANEKVIHDNEEASNDRLKHADAFDEIIRGTTTIVNTTTGEQRTVNMGDAQGILNGLNEGDPGLYKPLNEVEPPKP